MNPCSQKSFSAIRPSYRGKVLFSASKEPEQYNLAEIFPWGVEIGKKRDNKTFSLVFNENMSHSSFFLHGLMIWEEGEEGNIVEEIEEEEGLRRTEGERRVGKEEGGVIEQSLTRTGPEVEGKGVGEKEVGVEGGENKKENCLKVKEMNKELEERGRTIQDSEWEEENIEEDFERVGYMIKNHLDLGVKKLYYPTTLIIKTKCYYHEEMIRLLQTLYNILLEDNEVNGRINKFYLKNKVRLLNYAPTSISYENYKETHIY